MATVASSGPRPLPAAEQSDRLLFLVMSCVISVLCVAGFALNIAMGRAVPAPPLVFYMHAAAFTAWLAIQIAQGWLAWRNDMRWHRLLGTFALALLPVLVVLAIVMTIASVRIHGGPSFFTVSEFLFVNAMQITAFAALTGVAAAMWRKTDWHRRLMLCGFASFASPGIARLLPLPLLVPHVFLALFIMAMGFPAIAAWIDYRRSGKIHRAWLWGIGSAFAALFAGQVMAASDWGTNVTQQLIAGTPGAARPFTPFVPRA